MKKEFDDSRKHPEYNNFVREECISSSSDDDEERGFGNDVCSFSDHYRRSEEEDLEHMVPRGLWSGGKVIIIHHSNCGFGFKLLNCFPSPKGCSAVKLHNSELFLEELK